MHPIAFYRKKLIEQLADLWSERGKIKKLGAVILNSDKMGVYPRTDTHEKYKLGEQIEWISNDKTKVRQAWKWKFANIRKNTYFFLQYQ